NITDWALEQFRSRYGDASITKWDIFDYVYAVLHHPDYRQRYAANLRRELPRIPFVSATTLSSRAEQDRSLANDPVESRDPVSAGTRHGPEEEFSARTSAGGGRGRNSSRRPVVEPASAGSFDSAARVASDAGRSAQDDSAGAERRYERLSGGARD